RGVEPGSGLRGSGGRRTGIEGRHGGVPARVVLLPLVGATMADDQRNCGGSTSARWFVGLLSDIGFGAVEELVVRGGEPCPEPPPRVIRERRFGERRAPVPRER